MDAASLTIGIVQLSASIVQYVQSVKGASREMVELQKTLAHCGGIVKSFENLARTTPEDAAQGKKLLGLCRSGGLLADYESLLKTTEQRLKPKARPREWAQKLENKSLRYKWPLSRAETEASLQQLKVYLALLLAEQEAVQIAEFNEFRESFGRDVDMIKHNTRQTLDLMENEEFQHNCKQISEQDTHSRMNDALRKCDLTKPTWFLEEDIYRNWYGERTGTVLDSRILWAPGDPDAGKTTVAATVVQYIGVNKSKEDALLSFFCESTTDDNKKILRAFIRQMYEQLVRGGQERRLRAAMTALNHLRNSQMIPFDDVDSVHASSVQQYEAPHPSKEGWALILNQLSEVSILEVLAGTFWRVSCVIDGLDELGQNQQRSLMEDLMLIADHVRSVRILVFSRDKFADVFHGNPRLGVSARRNNIRDYIRRRIETSPRSSALYLSTTPEKKVIADKVFEKGQTIFLLAERHMDAICACQIPETLDCRIEEMSLDLRQTVDLAIQRIKQQCPESCTVGMRLLLWTVCAKRPLRLGELQHALATYSDRGCSDLHPRAVPTDWILKTSSEGLVRFNSDTNIATIHQSVHDYFQNNNGRKIEEHFPDAAAEIASICLKYLGFSSLGCLGEDPQLVDHNTFALYAAQNWGRHVRDADEEELFEDVCNLFKKPCNAAWAKFLLFTPRGPGGEVSFQTWMAYHRNFASPQHDHEKSAPISSNCVKFLVHFDLRETTKILLNEGLSLTIGKTQMTAFLESFANRTGQFSGYIEDGRARRETLAHDPSQALSSLRIAGQCYLFQLKKHNMELEGGSLLFGIETGFSLFHDKATRGPSRDLGLFLADNLEPDRAEQRQFLIDSAFWLAVVWKQSSCALLLASHGASTAMGNVNGDTILHVLARQDLVDFFKESLSGLEWSPALEQRNKWGHTPLHMAIKHRHVEHTKVLLDMGASVDSVDQKGETLSQSAEDWGDPEVLILLETKRENDFTNFRWDKALKCKMVANR